MLTTIVLCSLLAAEPAAATPAALPAIEMPRVVDDRLQLELILREPEIVTPVALTLDAKGRILVIESHTHFRPEGYVGPEFDRILLVDPTEKPAKPRVWYEGSKYTMGIGRAPDDTIYVATRSEIFRLRDTDGDDRADERKPIAHLETLGNYPHNGLSGFAFREGEVYFGFGENLGADYKLIGTDGSSLAGGGEGGNVYACKLDGSKVRRVATGFWNPFHMTFDASGNLFTVDNDPDSRPPCRLLHVVQDGDYGFKFRHGRKGTHPFTAWNGELPGTLPMVCGTGEAPCAVVEDTLDDGSGAPRLLVTSWGDHRIERYRLTSRGLSYRGEMEPLVVGNENFRPVGMAGNLLDGLYFSDWVDKSYPLHRKGRLWRLSYKAGAEPAKASLETTPSADVVSAEPRGIRRDWERAIAENMQDSFQWQELANRLVSYVHDPQIREDLTLPEFFTTVAKSSNSNATIWAAVAARNASSANAKALVPHLLASESPRVRTLGVIWVGDEGLTEFRADVERVLAQPGLTRELFECSLAALDMLDLTATSPGEKPDAKRRNSGDLFVLKALRDAKASPALRRFALKTLPADHPELKFDLLKKLVDDADSTMRTEAIRTLRDRTESERADLLRSIAKDEARSDAERAEAVVGLNPTDAADRELLEKLTSAASRETASEARRLLQDRPKDDRAMKERIATLASGGDPAAGERLFFHTRIGACYRCHEYAGRGAAIGPELTTIGRAGSGVGISREKLLQSILDPSAEIGPSYVPWIIETTDGRSLTGLYVGEEVKGEHRYADAQGKIFRVHPNDFAHREATKQSIMPADLGKSLTDDELRDLAAFLLQRP